MLLLNAALGALVYLYLEPLKIRKHSELTALNSQISRTRGDISSMQIEFDQLKQQQSAFDKLRQRGFFSDQQRRQAEKIFQSLQQQSGVSRADVRGEPGKVEDNEDAQKAEYKVLTSEVKIYLEALDSVDIFRYLYLLDKFFPGHVSIQDIVLERKTEVTGPVLRAIAAGESPPLVSAEFHMTWRTMIPQAEVISSEQIGGTK